MIKSNLFGVLTAFLLYCHVRCVHGIRPLTNGNDLSLNHYTDTGEVAQVAYASEAVRKAATAVVGFTLGVNVALLVVKKRQISSLLLPSDGKAIELYGDLILACTGRESDCDASRRYCNLKRNSHLLTFGEEPPVDLLARSLSQWLLRGMYRNDQSDPAAVARPLATAAMMACGSRLVVVECSGSIRDCTFACLGEKSLPGGPNAAHRLKEKLRRLIQISSSGGDNGDGNGSDNGRDSSNSGISDDSEGTQISGDKGFRHEHGHGHGHGHGKISKLVGEVVEAILDMASSDSDLDADADDDRRNPPNESDDEDAPLPYTIECAISCQPEADAEASRSAGAKIKRFTISSLRQLKMLQTAQTN
jgi:20S proteasome alpha/beta subunit